MNKHVALLLLLTACTPSGEKQADSPPAKQASPETLIGVGGKTLTGLYESGTGERRNQLCMIDHKSGAHFGLVVWGDNLNSCSGTGNATRRGDGLRLAMAGDSECAIEATFADGVVTLPKSLPAGCSYYCGARASLNGATFTRTGATRADALKAKDLVGEQLCEGQ